MSFSAQAFGEFAFSEQADYPLDSDDFQSFLDDVTAPRCYLLEIDALSLANVAARASDFGDAAFSELGFSDADSGAVGGTQTLRYSTHGYISKVYTGGLAGGDSENAYWYDGRLQGKLRIDRRIAGRSGLGGLAQVFAEIELANGDGGLDQLPGNYSLEGRAVRLYVGRPTDRFRDFGRAFSGVVQSCQIGMSSARLTLSDGAARLDRVVNETAYAGTGGAEGGSDLKGKAKPKAFGYVYNISPPLVNAASLVYQVHDGAILDVPAAYDRQVALTKVAAPPGAGQYSVDTSAGTITLGATPSGTVTCDVQGDASGSGYVEKAGELVLRLLNSVSSLTTSDIDSTSFVNLNGEITAPVGIWIGPEERRTVAECVDELLAGVGAYGGFNRQGAFTVGRIKSPAGVAPVATYTTEHILELEREPLPEPVEPTAWRVVVGWRRNYTVQADVASSVTSARRTFAAAAARVVTSESSSIKSRYLVAREYGPPPVVMVDQSDAEAEALRLFNLWAVPRGQYRVKLPIAALSSDLGSVVWLDHPRLRLAAGAPARVIAHSLLDPQTVELRVIV